MDLCNKGCCLESGKFQGGGGLGWCCGSSPPLAEELSCEASTVEEAPMARHRAATEHLMLANSKRRMNENEAGSCVRQKKEALRLTIALCRDVNIDVPGKKIVESREVSRREQKKEKRNKDWK